MRFQECCHISYVRMISCGCYKSTRLVEVSIIDNIFPMEAQSSVIMLQTLEVDKDTPDKFVHDLMVSKAEMAKEVPKGLLFSCGGFKLEATKPTFELITAWENEAAEEAFRHTTFYTAHHELFQKHSTQPIQTKVIKSLVPPTKPEDKKCLEVWIAKVAADKQNDFVAAEFKLKEGMKGTAGLLSSFGGVTADEVVTFILWDKLESHTAFKNSAEFGPLLKDCVALMTGGEVYHLQL
jgi:heme-degrading monooxygenase HmoA